MDDAREHESRRPRAETMREISTAYAEALLAADEAAAEIAIREAMDAGLLTREIDEWIIAPALWLIGEMWERDEISVADEHIATEITLRVLALQREAQRVASSRTGHRVMLAAPEGEQHVIALRMVANLLHAAGYATVMLGPDVPGDALAVSAERYTPAAICLTLTMPGQTDSLLRSIDEVREVRPSATFVVGGRGVTGRLVAEPGLLVCGVVSEVVDAVDSVVNRAALN